MNRTVQLHDLGQSLWLDNISRQILDDGTLRRYIDEFSITGLTSNPTIFQQALANTSAYDSSLRAQSASPQSSEATFIALALEDLRRAADLFQPIFEETRGVDGWVSMEVSPLLARDTQGSIEAARRIHRQAARPNLYVKIPGTAEGVPAIEQAIIAGVPINVTLLFSPKHYEAAAEAYLRGIERRIALGLDPKIRSVASLFISRWDKAVLDKVPTDLHNRLGIAVGAQAYRSYRTILASPRWKRLETAGAVPQRLLWASTGTKDPSARDTLYVEAFAVPDTIDTMPEKTLHAFADHGELGRASVEDIDAADALIGEFARRGVDVDDLAAALQKEGAEAFVTSWNKLMQQIEDKQHALAASA
ncbi:transaldolase [Labrys okinawensis]|uniref:transaldolase n=1 Tax=Labrys okinawensis TaxID=346911 RepID=UPI0039BD38BF